MKSKSLTVGVSALLCTSLALPSVAMAMGKAPAPIPAPSPAPAPSTGGGTSASNPLCNGSSQLGGIEDVALQLAIIYAQTDPRYAVILAALGINTPDDVKRLLCGDMSGGNLNGVISYLVMNYASKNANVSNFLNAANIHSFADIQNALKDPSGLISQDQLFQWAYEYASQNPQYAPWLQALGINSGADVGKVLQGGVNPSNLQSQLIAIGLAYLTSKGKAGDTASKLIPYLQTGAFQGLPSGDVSSIIGLMNAKK